MYADYNAYAFIRYCCLKGMPTSIHFPLLIFHKQTLIKNKLIV